MGSHEQFELTRRQFLIAGTVTAAAAMMPFMAKGQAVAAEKPALATVSLEVNGKSRTLDFD